MLRNLKVVAVSLASSVGLFAFQARADVPAAITTMFTDLTADVGTIVTAAVALMVAAFGVLVLIKFAKKAISRAV